MIRMRVSPVGPTGQTASSICASWRSIGCDCKPVRTWCASAGLSWLSGGPLKLLMNACVVDSSVMELLLDRGFVDLVERISMDVAQRMVVPKNPLGLLD